MATSPFFNNYAATNEQDLYESLVAESIKIYGVDTYYIPRKLYNLDKLYIQDDQSYYDEAYSIEQYIVSFDGFKGNGEFMSKFGIEIRDQVTFSVARRTFENLITIPYKINRPREGDLIYFPQNKKIFVIRYVNNFENFYQFGTLQTWEMTCENFEYSNEKFSTGIEEIDAIMENSTNEYDYALKDENGNIIKDDDGNIIVNEKFDLNTINTDAQNEEIAKEAATFIDFSVNDPFAEGNFEET